MTDEKIVITNLKRDGSKSHNRDDLTIKNFQGDFEKMKNYVGPAFIFSGIFGFGYGLFKSAREITFKNRPTKLIATSLINMVGKHTTRCANAGASITLMYCMLKKIINFIFEEEIQVLSPIQKQFLYGFITGALYKSTRGLKPMLLAGTLTSVACVIMQESYEKYINSQKKNKV